MRLKPGILLILLVGLILLLPSGDGSAAHRSTHKKKTESRSSSGSEYVRGYYRKDGTYVHGYVRHAAARSSSSRTRCWTCSRDRHGHIVRSIEAKREFRRMHPCPSTGRRSGPCPGYVIDHIVPLKRGGSDNPWNMQWQTKEAAKQKDKVE
jgi:hypothetical protein